MVKCNPKLKLLGKRTALAQETADPHEREHYERMRDAWITLANRYEFLNMSDPTE